MLKVKWKISTLVDDKTGSTNNQNNMVQAFKEFSNNLWTKWLNFNLQNSDQNKGWIQTRDPKNLFKTNFQGKQQQIHEKSVNFS